MQKLVTVLVSLLWLITTACSSDAPKSQLPPPREVIVPETTKVADADTRAALTAFDLQSGTLRYSRNTNVLAALKSGDVLVSEPSSAAPNGYLRKVTSLRSDGTGLVLETTQANLTDAIAQGELEASGELGPEDLATAKAEVDGLEVGQRPMVDVGDGYRFEASFNETVIDLSEGDVKAKVQISGRVYFNAGYNIGIGIEGPDLLEGRLLPEVDRFEAWVGFDQLVSLRVSGEANAKVTKEKKVAEYRYSPKCFFLGPIPVCVVPTVYLFVGASGQVNLKFDYGVTQTAQAKIGARWDDEHGWSKIEPAPQFNATLDQHFDVSGALNVQAYAKGEGALMFYGIAGPVIGVKLGLELDAAVPRNPLWIARGHLDTYYSFIVDFPIIGRVAESSGDIYKRAFEIGRSPNAKPKLSNVSVSSYGFFGHQFEFKCSASDPEDGVPEVTWTSNRSGEIGKGTEFLASLGYGTHTITARAKDSNGATAEQTVTVTIQNQAPRLTIDEPLPNTQYYAGQTAYFNAYSYDPETGSELLDASVSWSSNLDGLLGTGNFLSAPLSTVGTHTITATGSDAEGTLGTATLTLSVVPRPPDGNPPTCTFDWDYDPYPTGGSTPISLTGVANDTEDGPLYGNSLAWRFEIISGQVHSDLPEVSYGTTVNSIIRGLGKFRITLTATDSTGKTGTCKKEGSTSAIN